MQTRKFWCHYIGSDGNTPKRRSIELHNLADLVPNIPDNVHCETPVWYEERDDYYQAYVQLSDTVALSTSNVGVIGSDKIKEMLTTDAEFDAECEEMIKKYVDNSQEPMTDDEKEQERLSWKRSYEGRKKFRDDDIEMIKWLQNYTCKLLGGLLWITSAAIRAYQEINSPFLSTLQALRDKDLKEIEEYDRKNREQERKKAEKERKRQIEAEKKEQERLTEVAKKLKQGEHIKGCDVVSLCRRYGIKVHLRTVHNLQQVVLTINTNDAYTQPGEKAKLDGCFKTVTELYDYLQEHDAA